MIAADLGRVFEVGFNVGILTYIQQNQEKIDYRFVHMYRLDLQKLRFARMVEKIWEEEDVTSVDDRQIAKKWITFFVQRGFLAGLNFFQEYASYLMKNQTGRNKLEILYYQCNFYNENSLGTSPEDETKLFQRFLSQFSDPVLSIDHYAGKGEFLRADTLMLLRCKNDVRILSVDLSVFSIQSIKHMVDADEMTLLRHMLRREINRLRSKSIFTGLCIDTESLDFTFSENLARYFTAFKKEDKESAKLIQAASYAQSFYHFLLSHHILHTDDPVIFNIVGYTDRGVSTMSLNKERLGIL